MTFAQRRNYLTKRFSERIPVVKRSISVYPRTFKLYQFSWSVTMLNWRSCAPSAHVPRITWPWTLQLSVTYTGVLVSP